MESISFSIGHASWISSPFPQVESGKNMKIIYPIEWNERDHYERSRKGWLSDVIVEMDDGSEHSLSFYDPVRLQQDLEENVKRGEVAIVEKGLIVISEVTKENIEKAVKQAIDEGYFDY